MTQKIRDLMSETSGFKVEEFDYFPQIGSTNEYLLTQPAPGKANFRIAVAGQQSEGRGQHGRRWQSPSGAGIYVSVAYTFESRPENLPSLSLAVGVAVVQALGKMKIRGVGLKWPNDIVACDGKAGGILSEVYPGKRPSTSVVVGIGLNVDFSEATEELSVSSSIGVVTDLRCCCEELPERNAMIAGVLDAVMGAIQEFETAGIGPFIDQWQVFDWLRGQRVRVFSEGGPVSGVAQGIGSDGELLVKTSNDLRAFYSGSVSVRG